MNKKLGLLLVQLMVFSLIPLSFAQTSFDLEDIDLISNADFITDEDKQICGITELRNVILPFTMTVKYPQTLDVQLQITSNHPEVSEMKAIRGNDFFTVDTKNSTDIFTIKTSWVYETKPNYDRVIGFEVFSDNQRIQNQDWKFDDFTTCHIWTIETELKQHVPTLEEFLAENDIRINDAFQIVSQLQLDNNDLVLILIAIIVALFAITILLIAVMIWFNRDVSKKAEEAENRYNDATNHLDEVIAGVTILARNDYSRNDKLRDSFLKSVSLGSVTISNLVIDLRKILQQVLQPNLEITKDIYLKSDASLKKNDIDILKKQKKEQEPKKKFFGFITDKRKQTKDEKKAEKKSFEAFFEKYTDVKKYSSVKLAEIDKKLRSQYDKSPTPELTNEINAIAKVTEIRMGIK